MIFPLVLFKFSALQIIMEDIQNLVVIVFLITLHISITTNSIFGQTFKIFLFFKNIFCLKCFPKKYF